ncbi:unnamed protein product [Caenorhabditis auriculariae]|uniref:Transmembrane protein n=1 Tax=Caenorhabditis auriculariae TaxID=2777116 RepID=A0A8S1HMK2_9PELO|nr:unnamed protein product [Caenorhabditis auriculariae]
MTSPRCQADVCCALDGCLTRADATSICWLNTMDPELLDELLANIVATSMDDLRSRLQEALFAAAFRRRFAATTATPSKDSQILDKLIDQLLKPATPSPSHTMSVALETFTTSPVERSAFPRLVTAGELRLLDDADLHVEQKEQNSTVAWTNAAFRTISRVPTPLLVALALLAIFTVVTAVAALVAARIRRRQKFDSARRSHFRRRHMMPDPMTVAGLCNAECGSTASLAALRSTGGISLEQQDRATSVVWTNQRHI